MSETWLRDSSKRKVSSRRSSTVAIPQNSLFLPVDKEEADTENIQYVQKVVTRFQGIEADTWLKIIMLVSATLASIQAITEPHYSIHAF